MKVNSSLITVFLSSLTSVQRREKRRFPVLCLSSDLSSRQLCIAIADCPVPTDCSLYLSSVRSKLSPDVTCGAAACVVREGGRGERGPLSLPSPLSSPPAAPLTSVGLTRLKLVPTDSSEETKQLGPGTTLQITSQSDRNIIIHRYVFLISHHPSPFLSFNLHY